MTASVEYYKESFRSCILELQSQIKPPVKMSELNILYSAKFKKLLIEASQDDCWNDIASDIGFLLYAGAVQDLFFRDAVDKGIKPATDLINTQQQILVTTQKQIEKNKSDRIKAGKTRAENDPKHQAMKMIKGEYLEKWENGYRFPLGRLSDFYREMEMKYELEFSSIKNEIERYRKELGHSVHKKQSS